MPNTKKRDNTRPKGQPSKGTTVQEDNFSPESLSRSGQWGTWPATFPGMIRAAVTCPRPRPGDDLSAAILPTTGAANIEEQAMTRVRVLITFALLSTLTSAWNVAAREGAEVVFNDHVHFRDQMRAAQALEGGGQIMGGQLSLAEGECAPRPQALVQWRAADGTVIWERAAKAAPACRRLRQDRPAAGGDVDGPRGGAGAARR